MPHDFSQTHAAYALAAAAADESAIEELIAEAQNVSRRGDRVALTSIFVSRYSEIDPRAAIEFVAEAELESKPDLLYRVFEGWSKLDLDAAIAAAGDLGTTAEQQAAVAAILRAHSDAGAGSVALIMSRLLAAGVSGNPQLNSAIQSASGEPEAALAAALAQPRELAEQLVANIGAGWAIQDPEAAFAYSRAMRDDTLRRRMVSGVFYSWIERDPEHVLGMLDGELTNDERNALINTGLVRLAKSDPVRALELSQRVESFAYRQSALQRTFRTWAESDPAAAAAALERVDGVNSDNMDILTREVGAAYALRAPAAALEWAYRIGDGQVSPEFLGEVARGDPALALDAALKQGTEAQRDHAIGQIAQRLAVDDATTATDFWRTIPAEHRATAADRIVMAWAQRDPNAATRWVMGIPPGTDQQRALRTLLIMQTAADEIANYGQLLAMLDSAEERDSIAYNRIATLARSGNRERAEAEIDRLQLSPEAYRRARDAIDGETPGP